MTVATILSTVVFGIGIFTLSYFLVVNTTYILITVHALLDIRDHRALDQYEPVGSMHSNRFLPGVAVVVPAYNEGGVIVDSVKAMLSLAYPNKEVIVVNDGSTDDTLDRLREQYSLQEVDAEFPLDLPTESVKRVFRAQKRNLVVIDKENGGKADALNAGLFYTEEPLFCAVDADTIIEHDALIDIVEPFLTNPTETVATGGVVRIANGCSFKHSSVTNVELSKNRLVKFQAVEYLRAFLLGRIGLSRLDSLLIISGAFGLFRTDVVREIGGYDTESITEDMELVVRLHRYLIEEEREYAVKFLPRPVAWTEVPESRTLLSRQRRRWFRGLVDTLSKHRRLIGNRTYGAVGLLALPFFVFIEMIGPLVEGAGYVLIPLLFLLGLLEMPFVLAFFAVAVALSAVMSTLGVFGEVVTYRRYTNPKDVVVMLTYGILESVTYRPWRAFVTWYGLIEYLKGDRSWGEMPRLGFDRDSR